MSEEAAASSGQANAANVPTVSIDSVVDKRGVPLGNVLAEVNRKLAQGLQATNQKLDALLQLQTQGASPDKGKSATQTQIPEGIDPKVVNFVQDALSKERQAEIAKAQKAALDSVYKTFPELDQNSESFDTEFFNLAVEIENTISEKDPQRSMKAAKLAALELGKVEKITKAKVVADEANRRRILSEGGAQSKETRAPQKKMSTENMNKAAIKQFFKVDPAEVEKYAKEDA